MNLESIKAAIKHYEYGVSHDIFSEPVTTYAKTALAALRECAERREGCEWCKTVIVTPCKTCDAQSIGGNACGEYMYCGSYYRYFKATERQLKKYCPNCGARMGATHDA